MNRHLLRSPRAPLASEDGFSIVEMMIAATILIVVMTGVMGAISMSSTITENQGHLSARTAEYAQDKMEQLLALAYSDAVSDTTQIPTAGSGGSGLTIGGSSDPSAPAANYVDYLDKDGTPLCPCTGTTAPSGWYYKRVWQVSQAGTNLKQITLAVVVASSVGNQIVPTTLLTTYRSMVGNE